MEPTVQYIEQRICLFSAVWGNTISHPQYHLLKRSTIPRLIFKRERVKTIWVNKLYHLTIVKGIGNIYPRQGKSQRT